MKQFYETYAEHEKLSPLVTEITWTNHLAILSKAKTLEEKEFYLQLTRSHHYSKRELERLIDTATFERASLGTKLSPLVTEIEFGFKDTYVFEFLTLPSDYKENDLRRGLLGLRARMPLQNSLLDPMQMHMVLRRFNVFGTYSVTSDF